MEQKKTIKADLERLRLTWFLVGLVVALSLLLAALELPMRDSSDDVGAASLDDVMQEMEMMRAPDRQDMIAAVEPHPRKAATQKIKVVDMKRQMENIVDIAKQRTVGEAGGTATGDGAKGDATAGADDNVLDPVAVDMGDNPLNFRVVEQLPEFPGGMSALVKWLTDNIKYPALAQRQNIQGRVVITFVINRDGTTSDIKVASSANPMLDREALRVARMMPRWKPGVANNRPCRTMFAIPIEFRL